MGKYRAKFSVPNHLFGTIKDYDDNDPVVQHRVKAGMLERVDGPVEEPKAEEPAVEETPKAPVKKRAAKRAASRPAREDAKSEPEVEGSVEVEGEESTDDVPEPEGDSTTVQAPSSVMTSWTVSE